MNKFNIGDVCILDPTNKLNIAGSSIIYVKILKIKGFFTFKFATVCICDKQGNLINEKPFTIPVKALVPNGSQGDNIVIRYPENTPMLTKEDFKTYYKLYILSTFEVKCSEDENFNKRCKILLEKIRFFSDIVTEY